MNTFLKAIACAFVFCSSSCILHVIAFQKADQPADAQQKAQMIWEQAIAAKGGRERLYQVNSLAISYQETWRNFLGFVVHRGPVEQLYVFPDKFWSWEDEAPPFRLIVSMLNLERGISCELWAGDASPRCKSPESSSLSPDAGLIRVQYLYLMETRWVKPAPLNVTRDVIGFKKVDVVQTHVGDRRVDYYLDRKTHLPLRVAIFYSNEGDRPSVDYNFSQYVNINGIQMPGKQRRGRINLQINPAYDESIFTRPPSFDAGPKAWQALTKVH